jgi:magnesium transporter
MVLAFIVSLLIFQFEETITSNVLLAALMPVVALIGGNSGAQSLAIVIRALARNDVSEARVLDVIGKQTLIGIINGILVGTFSFLILSFVGLGDFSLALGSAVFTNIFIGNFFGSSIPLILKKLGFDPALASNIFLTLVTDIAGFGGFLAIALLLL